MPTLIPRQPESAHWYLRDGTPFHQVEYADPKRKGQFRPTTLKDAKAKGALGSVTTIWRIIHNPVLVNWKLENAILAALTLPRIEGEIDDAFAARVAADCIEQVEKAASFGSAIHDAIETYLIERKQTDMADLLPYLAPAYAWIDANVEQVIGCEYVVVSDDGYAGRVDAKIVLRRGLTAYSEVLANNPDFNGILTWDIKTRKSNAGKIISYDSDITQLAAYHKAEQEKPAAGLRPSAVASFYISSNEPLSPQFKPWSADNLSWGWQAFSATLAAWKILNRYDPTKP